MILRSITPDSFNEIRILWLIIKFGEIVGNLMVIGIFKFLNFELWLFLISCAKLSVS